jgi:zinc protease
MKRSLFLPDDRARPREPATPARRKDRRALRRPWATAGLLLCLTLGTASGGTYPPDEPETRAAGAVETAAGFVRKEILENGIRVLLLPVHHAPVAASVVVVRAGAVYETEATSGASHFLEHLLFNGTENLTQEQLYAAADAIGAYNNATTGRLQTAFIMLAPSVHLGRALRLHAEMLFRSTLPPDKVEKERGIILEELEKDRASESYDFERLVREALYRAEGYRLPVLGTPLSIENLSREAIWTYYKAHYVPQAMTILLVGDFDPEAIVDTLAVVFGREPPAPEPPPPPPEMGALVGQRHLTFHRALSRSRVVLHLPAPPVGSPERLAAEAAVDLLAGDRASPLGRMLAERLGPDLLDLSASLVPAPGPGRLEVTMDLDPGADTEAALSALLEAISGFSWEELLAPEDLEGWKRTERAQEYFQRERPHYYGMLRAADCALLGPWEVAQRPRRIQSLGWDEVRRVAAQLFGNPVEDAWSVTVAAQAAQASGRASAPAETLFVRLKSGARILILRSPDSPVLAFHYWDLGRALREPPGADGATELLHRMLPEGVGGSDATAFQKRLRWLGAELKTADLDFIPYDDADTRADFSFVRLQTLDEVGPQASQLLGDLLRRPTLSREAFQRARGGLLARVRRDAKNPAHRARTLLRQALYGRHPAARDPFGNRSTLEALAYEDLLAYAKEAFRPGNAFLVVGTARQPGVVLRWLLEDVFPGDAVADSTRHPRPQTDLLEFWSAAGDTVERRWEALMAGPSAPEEIPWAALRAALANRGRILVDSLGAGRGHVLVAALLTGLNPEDRAAWTVWNAWVSDRLAFRLREQMGMAYGIGSSLRWLGPERALWIASASTRPGNLEAMAAGLLEGLDLAARTPPSDEEVATTAASLYGRALMRRSTRMKQCHYAALALLMGKELEAEASELEAIRLVDPERVRTVGLSVRGRAPLVIVVR